MIKMDGILKVCGTLVLAGCSAVSAYEIEHGTHVHGAAVVNVAIEGETVAAELESPLFNIAGFEHTAESAADKSTQQRALTKLRDGSSLIQISPGAKCSLKDVDVELATEHETHAEHHDDHKHHDHHEEHAHHAEQHHKHKEGEEHQDIHAQYRFTCENPAGIRLINFAFFKEFPELQKIKVNLISEKGVVVKELTQHNPEISI